MKFHGMNYVYECLPPFRNNRTLPEDEQIVIGLKRVSKVDEDACQLSIAEVRGKADAGLITKYLAYAEIEEESKKLIASKVAFIRGLEIEGIGPVTDFDTFSEQAPRELVAWVAMAVMNTGELIRSERINFVSEDSEEPDES